MYGMVGGGGGGGGGGRISSSASRSSSRRKLQRTNTSTTVSGAATGNILARPPRSLYRRLLALIKQAWTGVKFGSDSELDIPEQEPRYRPEDINALVRTTHFTRPELQRFYRGFKDRCPTGVVREEVFKEMYSQMFPKGASTSQYAHYVFSTLDKENSGIINFEDFISLVSRLTRGTTEDKLRWIFSLYDLNGDGCITRQEMTDLVQAVFDLMGKHTDVPIDETTIGQRVETLFTMLDQNRDGVITLDEFMDSCSQDLTLRHNLDAMVAYL
ncbi:A-type potassium channel modulatory protein KCNIP1-like [Oratosquilla oratoria]|uniref:A-type potassium channel modulatory protein KCNIP1-like n=1 Tax=Oratosquilla oratoria TaxID=337810 RepID=UPI003F76AE8D